MISSAYSSRDDESGLEHPVRLVRLVDRERVVRDQLTDRVGDADEQSVERLLCEHLVEDVGQPTVRLDESRFAERALVLEQPQVGGPHYHRREASVPNPTEAVPRWRDHNGSRESSLPKIPTLAKSTL